MSAFHTKFGANEVLPNEVPTFASYRPSNFVSNAVGGEKKSKTKKVRKNWKKTKTEKRRTGGKRDEKRYGKRMKKLLLHL